MLLNALQGCNIGDFNNNDTEEDDNNTSDIPQNIIKLLRRNSPLSDTVLLTFLRMNFPPNKIKRVLLKNIDFSYRVSEYYRTMSLSQNIRQQIDPKRIDHVPYLPGYDDFEKLFPNFISYRSTLNEQERLFLNAGNLPESAENPRNLQGNLPELEGALFNQFKEIKIGNDVIKIMNEKNILIKNASVETVNYIRQNNKLPRITVPSFEPENGLLASSAPPVISPDIIIESTDIFNVNCGVIFVQSTPSEQGRISYSTNIGGTEAEGFNYYWQFSDGYVSYKRNPTHRYVGENGVYTVSVTVYDSFGNNCGGSSGGGYGGGNPNGGNSCGNVNVSGISTNLPSFDADFDAFINLSNYVSNSAISCFINWGDGTTQSTILYANDWHNFTKTFPFNVYTEYNASITITYGNCSITTPFKIKFTQPANNTNPSCDKKDVEKDKWTTNLDNNLRISHKLKLSNTIAVGGKFTSELKTYHKIQNIFGGTWTPINAFGCVDLVGNFFSPCLVLPTTQACSGTPTALNPGPNCQNWWFKTSTWNAGSCKYYILTNGMSSNASAWGLSSTLSIGD